MPYAVLRLIRSLYTLFALILYYAYIMDFVASGVGQVTLARRLFHFESMP